jgi:hypothetical protein
MKSQLRFITDEQGQQVGVLLGMAEYRQLTEKAPLDPELLLGLSEGELRALAEMKLSPTEQKRLSRLLARNVEKLLTPAEQNVLDRLLRQVDHLSILKARALYTLQQRSSLLLPA